MDDAKQYALDLGSKTDQKVENKTNKDKITVKIRKWTEKNILE